MTVLKDIDERLLDEALAWRAALESDDADWDGYTLWLEADARHREAFDQIALTERIVDDLGIKPKFAFAPIRVAISGRTVSPPLFESMEILGRDESLVRLRALRGFVG